MYAVLITTLLSSNYTVSTVVVQFDTEADAESCVRHIHGRPNIYVNASTVSRTAERLT